MAWTLCAVVAAMGLGSSPALALTACTAADIVAQDPGCAAGATPCTVTKTFTVTDGCSLDFGTRRLSVSGTGRLDAGSGSMSIAAAGLTVSPGGFIGARGASPAPPNDIGGDLAFRIAGDVLIQRAGAAIGRIDASAKAEGGSVSIDALGSVAIAGMVDVGQQLYSDSGGGGSISISACGDITGLAGSSLTASAGALSSSMGSVDLLAGGTIDFVGLIDVSGSEGGDVSVDARGGVTLGAVNANALLWSEAGSGGYVDIMAGTAVRVLGPIDLNGSGSSFETGGDGGILAIAAEYGNLTTAGRIFAQGAGPDGSGGEIGFDARGGIDVGAGVSASSSGFDSSGGTISLESEGDVTTRADVDASGGSGGDIDVTAARRITLVGPLAARATAAGGYGGAVTVEAGAGGSGSLSVADVLDVRGGGCLDGDCGGAGTIDLTACDISVGESGRLLATGPDGGQQLLTAAEQITIAGRLDARSTGGQGTLDGEIAFTYPSRRPPVTTGTILPAPALDARETCSDLGQAGCLPPCPVCGDGVVDYPETCDNQSGTSCAGCSFLCRIEQCDDGNPATVDACDPALGCHRAEAARSCVLTSWGTPTVLAPTRTRTPSPTPTPRLPTFSPRPSPSPTAVTLPTRTPTATATATHAPPLGPCVADCNHDGHVTINEVVAAVNIFLGADVSLCRSADQDESGGVLINEVVAGVNAFLSDGGSCPRVNQLQ